MTGEEDVRLVLDEQVTYEGDKRQVFPYTVHWTCPRCGVDHKTERDYLSYPEMGRNARPFKLMLSCEGANDEGQWEECWTGYVPIRVELYAEVVGSLTSDEESPGSNR